MINYQVVTITDENISSLEILAAEATLEGYNFVRKTLHEWKENNFSKLGENFWGILVDGECIAMGGLNIDPYTKEEGIGRVRHVYVSKRYRRQGFSKILLSMIIAEAKKNFTMLRLSTSNPTAALAYESLGFEKCDVYKATHILYLK